MNTADTHALKIAYKTLKMTPVGASIMGQSHIEAIVQINHILFDDVQRPCNEEAVRFNCNEDGGVFQIHCNMAEDLIKRFPSCKSWEVQLHSYGHCTVYTH